MKTISKIILGATAVAASSVALAASPTLTISDIIVEGNQATIKTVASDSDGDLSLVGGGMGYLTCDEVYNTGYQGQFNCELDNLNPGQHSISLYAADSAGNYSPTVQAEFDVAHPDAPVITSTSSYKMFNTLYVNGQVTDSNSDLQNVILVLQDGIFTECNVYPAYGQLSTFSCSANLSQYPVADWNAVRVIATDEAEHSSLPKYINQ
mgnify:CR=1 FL=1